jgi:molybdopterin-guanine dinucleotide biosynthesis protein A
MASTLAILAGGSGTRMGTPKSYLTIRGKPILEHLAEQIAWPGPTVLVTAPGVEGPPGHQKFSAEITDPVGGEGPLRGILTALKHNDVQTLVVTTVDMPNITREQLEWFDRQLEITEHCIALACRRDSTMTEPFPCAVRAAAAEPIQKMLAAGRNAVKQLFELRGSHVVNAPPDWLPSVWLNLNNPQDLDLLET